MTLPGSVVYDWCEEQMTGQGKVNTNSAETWESYATWRNYDVSPRCLLVLSDTSFEPLLLLIVNRASQRQSTVAPG